MLSLVFAARRFLTTAPSFPQPTPIFTLELVFKGRALFSLNLLSSLTNVCACVDPAFVFRFYSSLTLTVISYYPLLLFVGGKFAFFPVGAHAVTQVSKWIIWSELALKVYFHWASLHPLQCIYKNSSNCCLCPQITWIPSSSMQHLGEPKSFPWVGTDWGRQLALGLSICLESTTFQSHRTNTGRSAHSKTRPWYPSRSDIPPRSTFTHFLMVPFNRPVSQPLRFTSSSVFSNQSITPLPSLQRNFLWALWVSNVLQNTC